MNHTPQDIINENLERRRTRVHRALLTQRTHAPKRMPLQASESHSVACLPITTWHLRSCARIRNR